MAILTVADSMFLTILKKRENRLSRFSLDIMKKQVA